MAVATAAAESTKPLELEGFLGATRTLDPGSRDPASIPGGALCVQTSKVRTVCVRSARADPCGGCRVTGHPYRDRPIGNRPVSMERMASSTGSVARDVRTLLTYCPAPPKNAFAVRFLIERYLLDGR